MYGDPASREELDSLRRELGYRITDLEQSVDDLCPQLRVLETLRQVVNDLREQLSELSSDFERYASTHASK